MRKPPVYLLGWGECNNASAGPRYRANPLITGITQAGKRSFDMAGVTHKDIRCLNLYDDYIPIVMIQIEDLGFSGRNDKAFFEKTDFTFKGDLPIQTSGGMINCGQPSTTGGMGTPGYPPLLLTPNQAAGKGLICFVALKRLAPT